MPAIDQYSGFSPSAGGPANSLFAITPSDGVELPFVTSGIYVGGAGDVAVKDRATGATVIFRAVPAGLIIPARVAQILATGTTATNLVGMA